MSAVYEATLTYVVHMLCKKSESCFPRITEAAEVRSSFVLYLLTQGRVHFPPAFKIIVSLCVKGMCLLPKGKQLSCNLCYNQVRYKSTTASGTTRYSTID